MTEWSRHGHQGDLIRWALTCPWCKAELSLHATVQDDGWLMLRRQFRWHMRYGHGRSEEQAEWTCTFDMPECEREEIAWETRTWD